MINVALALAIAVVLAVIVGGAIWASSAIPVGVVITVLALGAIPGGLLAFALRG